MRRTRDRKVELSTSLRRVSIATRILFANLAMLVGIIVLVTTLVYADAHRAGMRDQAERLRSIVQSLAVSELAIEQVQVERVQEVHPDPLDDFRAVWKLSAVSITPAVSAQIGAAGQGGVSERGPDLARAYGGQVFVDVHTWPDGSQEVYAAAPIRDRHDGSILGVAMISQPQETYEAASAPRLGWLMGIGGIGLVLGGIATLITAAGLRRVTGNYGTVELSRLVDHHTSVLHAVSEGLLLIDRREGIVVRNAKAIELLGLPAEDPGTPLPLGAVDLPETLRELLSSGRTVHDEIHSTDRHVLVVSQQRTGALTGGRPTAETWVTTLLDHTELEELTGELVSVRGVSESLRSQTHEYANRLHMITSLIETGRTEEALEFAGSEINSIERPGLSALGSFDHPVLSALLLAKIAQASERGCVLEIRSDRLTDLPDEADRRLVTIVGNLVDNALDALADQPADRRRIRVEFAGSAEQGCSIEISDDGPGIPEESIDDAFGQGWSTKHEDGDEASGHGRGYGLFLVLQAVRRLGGAIDVRGHGEEADELRGAGFQIWIPGTRTRGGRG